MKWWSVERKSEEGIVAVIDVDNTTRRSEGPPARCARPTGEGARDCRERLFALEFVHLRTGCGCLGSSPTRVASWNAAGRLPGGKPDEGELHVRFGKGEQETGLSHRACSLLHTCEAGEQRRASGRGVGGGKAPSQGEHGQQNASRTQSRIRRVKCAGSCASSGTRR